MSNKRTAGTVVIGGGAVGTSVACYLAMSGMDVTLGSGLINCQKGCKRVLIVCQEVNYEYSLLSFPCPA